MAEQSFGKAPPPDHQRKGPTTRPPEPPGLSSVLERNIQILSQRRRQEEAQATIQDRLADAITRFTGSMFFVYLHVAFFGFWIVANLKLIPGAPVWDPSFVMLAMIASVEAIFLSTFVLISQNRMAAAADRRADLDLQISLLAEHEVTKLATLISAIAQHMGVRTEVDEELNEIQRDVAPEAVLDEIEETKPKSE
jgi:Predicted membrane protein